MKKYKKTYAWFKFYISKEGDLIDVIHPKNLKRKIRKEFGLACEIVNTHEKSLSLFEKDALKLLSNIKKWDVKKHLKTNVPVSYVKHISLVYNLDSNKWSYEF